MIYYLLTINTGGSPAYKVLQGNTYEELEDQLQDYLYLEDALVEWEEISCDESKTFI